MHRRPLHARDDRQHGSDAEPAGDPNERANAPRRAVRDRTPTVLSDLLLPQGGMTLFHFGQPRVHLRQMRIALCLGQRAVERGALALRTEILRVASQFVLSRHAFASLYRVLLTV